MIFGLMTRVQIHGRKLPVFLVQEGMVPLAFLLVQWDMYVWDMMAPEYGGGGGGSNFVGGLTSTSDTTPGSSIIITTSFYPNGTTTNTFTATDTSGNTSTCSFMVTINDITPPVFTYCPNDSNLS